MAKDLTLQVLGPRYEIMLCLQAGHSKLALEGVREVFATVNNLLETDIYHVRLFDCFEALISDRSLGQQTERVASCIFVGSTRERWPVAPELVSPLRHLLQRSQRVGLIASGVFLAAETGMLRDRMAAIHPNFLAIFQEEFSDTDIVSSYHTRLDPFFTASNPISAVGLALEFVGLDLGRDMQRDVMQLLGAPSDCDTKNLTRVDKLEIVGRRDPMIDRCIRAMKANIETPLAMSTLASMSGVSIRQIERRFRSCLGMSPVATYRTIRLQHARRLLHQTKLSTLEVALSSGFGSAAHFGKSYRRCFGLAPGQDRGPRINIHVETQMAATESAA